MLTPTLLTGFRHFPMFANNYVIGPWPFIVQRLPCPVPVLWVAVAFFHGYRFVLKNKLPIQTSPPWPVFPKIIPQMPLKRNEMQKHGTKCAFGGTKWGAVAKCWGLGGPCYGK
jgi:hypothetical protein